jgi:hypothetical protein
MTKVYRRTSLPALDNSKSVQNPDLLNIADKNYTTTIMRYSNLALLFSQLETNDKHIVGAINELNRRPILKPAKKVGETDVVGGVIIGDGIDVTAEGVISTTPYKLPPATTETLGAVIVGDNLSVTPEGVLSASAQQLEPATKTKLGGIKVGDYLNITAEGTLSVDSSAVGKTYYSGKLTTIDQQNKINVNMTKSTPADIEQESADNPNVLFFTEGSPGQYTALSTYVRTITTSEWQTYSGEYYVDINLPDEITSISASLILSFEYLGTVFEDTLLTLGISAIRRNNILHIYSNIGIPDASIKLFITYWDVGSGDTVIINTLPVTRHKEVIHTLYANMWDPVTHLYSISADSDAVSSSLVTAHSQQLILPLLATSAENIENNALLQSYNIQDAGQSVDGSGNGTISLYAETVPTQDLRIRVIYNG